MLRPDSEFTEADFKRALRLWKHERIRKFTSENLFRGGLYCILTAAENYGKQMKAYERIIEHDMDTPEGLLANPKKLKAICKGTRYNIQRTKYLSKFAEWWPKTDFPERLVEDVKDGRKKSFELRELLDDEAYGVSRKTASLLLRMCGYRNLVPLDQHMLEYLREKEYRIRIPGELQPTGEKLESGITKKEYYEWEGWVSDIAKRYGASPAFFQATVYAKGSDWKPRIHAPQHHFGFHTSSSVIVKN